MKPDSSPTEALPRQAPRADGDLRLVDVVPLALEVALDAEGDLDTHLLVRLENIIEDIVHREEEAQRT